MRQAILIPQQGGGYIGLVPSFPDIEVDGLTREETIANLNKEITAYYGDYQYDGKPMPDDVPGAVEVIDLDEVGIWWKYTEIIDDSG